MGTKWLIICLLAAKYVCVSSFCESEKAFSNDTFQYDENYKFPRQRNWFLKRITVGLFTAGRLTTTMIKYVSEHGYKGIISQYNWKREGRFGEDVLPTTDQAHDVATRYEMHTSIGRN